MSCRHDVEQHQCSISIHSHAIAGPEVAATRLSVRKFVNKEATTYPLLLHTSRNNGPSRSNIQKDFVWPRYSQLVVGTDAVIVSIGHRHFLRSSALAEKRWCKVGDTRMPKGKHTSRKTRQDSAIDTRHRLGRLAVGYQRMTIEGRQCLSDRRLPLFSAKHRTVALVVANSPGLNSLLFLG